jgi:predicted small lipoprotein YifL
MDADEVFAMNKSMVPKGNVSPVYYAALAAVLCVSLAGCNVGPKYMPPVKTAPPAYKESPEQFKETGEWTVAQPQDASLRGKWWEIYNEPELNALEDQLNIDNQNIRQSFESFMEARALVRQVRSQFFPTLHRRTLLRRPAATSQAVSSRRCFHSLAKPHGNRIFGEKCAIASTPANMRPN